MSLLLIAGILLAALIFLTHPSFNYRRGQHWLGQRFAHRGLHAASEGVPENTLPAFERACRAGYGIELDIRFTKDMRVVVYHDDDLLRLCGDPRKVCQLTLEELRALPVQGTDARVPTLDEALELVNGRVPLLIELKNGKDNPRLCRALMDRLKNYPGEYIVESFNPLIVWWFRRNAPQVVRGQLVGPLRSYMPTVGFLSAFFMSGLLLNFLGRPHFVAYDVNAPRFFSPHFQRFLFHTPMAAWTVRRDDIARLVEKRRQMCIFEEIQP